MIVQCEKCQTKFKLADEKVTAKGVKIRCRKCSHVFVVKKEAAPAAPPAPAPAADDGFSFDLDGFGSGDEAGDTSASDFDFADKPLGARPPAKTRPDRPMRPGPGVAPAHSQAKPAAPDVVFAEPSTARAAKEGGEFDNLDELFGPSKKRPAAPEPAPAPAAKPAPKPSDPFGDSYTLDTQPETGGAPADDSFGGVFESAEASPPRKSGGGGGVEFDFGEGKSGIETEGPAPEHAGTGSGSDFDSLLTGEAPGGFFGGGEGGGHGGEAAHGQEEVAAPDPGLQWGPKKQAQTGVTGGGGSAGLKIGVVVVVLLLLLGGGRASIEFAPDLYFQMGFSYDRVAELRESIPFPVQNADFPKPPKFWDVKFSQTFTITNQFEKDLFVASGQVTNISRKKRGFFMIEVQAVDDAGNPIGTPEKVFAGNSLDVEALKRLPVAQVRKELNRRIGENGVNVEVAAGTSLPFMVIFTEWPQVPARVEVLRVEATALE